MVLVDPEKITVTQASHLSKNAKKVGTSAIMVGGSTRISPQHLEEVICCIKQTVDLPVILFPSNLTGISCHADGIWFMSLLNSLDPYFLIGAQVLGAPLIKRYKLEPISLGYIIIGDGGTAGIVGKAIPLPYDKPEIIIAHALAGQYLGMHFIYLEAGSGAKNPVPPGLIQTVKKSINIPLIIGGGIKTKKQVSQAVSAGADVIVTGNIFEINTDYTFIAEIVKGIKNSKD